MIYVNYSFVNFFTNFSAEKQNWELFRKTSEIRLNNFKKRQIQTSVNFDYVW